MPSQSTLNPDEKNKVKAAIPPASNKILFATLARIYYAHPQPNEWSYAGLQGALAFVRDTSKNTQSFQLVDLDGTRGVIWQFEVYKGLEYYPDRAFFHSFAADVCLPQRLHF
jgi:Wiskott-Aldrich syndrome protein